MNISFTLENTEISAINFHFSKFSNIIPSHSHGNDCYEIHYIPEGYGKLCVNDTYYDITPNTLYITGPHISHAQFPLPTDPMKEYCLYIKINHAHKSAKNTPILNTFMSTPFWFGADTQDLLITFRQLSKELENQSVGYLEKMECLLRQLIIDIVRNYKKVSKNHFQKYESDFADNESLVIEEYFLYEYATLSLEDLATRLNLSTRQTERILKEYYGKTFQQKKLEARMSAAAILLEDKTNSISYISNALGYSSLEHFSNSFKKYYHMPPSEFRKLHC